MSAQLLRRRLAARRPLAHSRRLLMTKLTRNLIAIALAAVFSFSAAAASACDGMKDHRASGDSQAKNDNGGKAAAKTKDKTDATKSRDQAPSDDNGNKS